MPRAPRLEFAGARYHVINRGNYRQDLFTTHKTGAAFEKTLFEACGRFGWQVHAYVLMSNHYHLALETPEPNLSVGMQWLQGVFANRFNHFVKTPGHVFQGRYQALVIEPGPSLLRVVNYIHLNPVRANICELKALKSYELSSFPKLYEPDRWPHLTSETWLGQSGSLPPGKLGMRQYHKHLELAVEGRPTERERLFRELCRGWFIGSAEGKKALVTEMQASAKAKSKANDELIFANARHDEDAAASALAEALEALGKSQRNIAEDRKSAEWKIGLARDLRSRFAISNRWLGEQLNMGHPCAVSRLLAG
ncbi:transposase [Cerasicoccus frondis]|uniref:transposase n=1 Tax=Cerasicoccus frondis TaxID=490090 RepID=UPI0028526783|nr:transposase [Cerasicoccus frondis]